MATTPTVKNRSTHRIRSKYYHLGIDSEGAAHVYRTSDETIFAIAADGTREYRFDLTACGQDPDTYVKFVREQRGFETCQFGIAAYLDRIAEVL